MSVDRVVHGPRGGPRDIPGQIRLIRSLDLDHEIPAVFSCNKSIVWPTVGWGWSSPHELEDVSGVSWLLDDLASRMRRHDVRGGRFEVQADHAETKDGFILR